MTQFVGADQRVGLVDESLDGFTLRLTYDNLEAVREGNQSGMGWSWPPGDREITVQPAHSDWARPPILSAFTPRGLPIYLEVDNETTRAHVQVLMRNGAHSAGLVCNTALRLVAYTGDGGWTAVSGWTPVPTTYELCWLSWAVNLGDVVRNDGSRLVLYLEAKSDPDESRAQEFWVAANNSSNRVCGIPEHRHFDASFATNTDPLSPGACLDPYVVPAGFGAGGLNISRAPAILYPLNGEGGKDGGTVSARSWYYVKYAEKITDNLPAVSGDWVTRVWLEPTWNVSAVEAQHEGPFSTLLGEPTKIRRVRIVPIGWVEVLNVFVLPYRSEGDVASPSWPFQDQDAARARYSPGLLPSARAISPLVWASQRMFYRGGVYGTSHAPGFGSQTVEAIALAQALKNRAYPYGIRHDRPSDPYLPFSGHRCFRVPGQGGLGEEFSLFTSAVPADSLDAYNVLDATTHNLREVELYVALTGFLAGLDQYGLIPGEDAWQTEMIFRVKIRFRNSAGNIIGTDLDFPGDFTLSDGNNFTPGRGQYGELLRLYGPAATDVTLHQDNNLHGIWSRQGIRFATPQALNYRVVVPSGAEAVEVIAVPEVEGDPTDLGPPSVHIVVLGAWCRTARPQGWIL